MINLIKITESHQLQIHDLDSHVLICNSVWFPLCSSVPPLLDAVLFLPKHMLTFPSKVSHPAPGPLLEVMADSISLPPGHQCLFTQVIATSPVDGTGTIARLSPKNLTFTICSPAADIPLHSLHHTHAHIHMHTHKTWLPPTIPAPQ